MSDLKTSERLVLEKLFQMEGGYVLDFSNWSIRGFFDKDIGIDFFDEKYNYRSGSKANHMRGFWQAADNALVGNSVLKLIEYIDSQVSVGKFERVDFPQHLANRGREIGNRLLGKSQTLPEELTEDKFLGLEYEEVSIDSLGVPDPLPRVLQQRLDEIRRCLNAKAPLATVFLCGSTLEGILLGLATENPREFNGAASSPKRDGKVKRLHEWTLNELIDVARETGSIGEDVRKFSHALRGFRNYIHPHEQAVQDFVPDEHTARICSQVLAAAISQISKR